MNDVKILDTPDGVRFGMLGEKGAVPKPTLINFANDIKTTLTGEVYSDFGKILVEKGFIAVSLDLPAHGDDVRPGETAALKAWRDRIENGDTLVPAFISKAKSVLDYLIQEGYTDPSKIVAFGTSRGGFIAMHLAAADPRVKYVVGIAPVTDLLALREFAGMEKNAATNSLALRNYADKLTDQAIWLTIGNNDERVGTDLAISLTRSIVKAAVSQGKKPNVAIRITADAAHTTPPGSHKDAAEWALFQLGMK